MLLAARQYSIRFHLFPQNEPSAEEAPRAPERSPVWRRRDRKGSYQSGPNLNSDANVEESGASENNRGVSREEELSSGSCGHLTKLVLKFTTASESDVQPSCEVRVLCWNCQDISFSNPVSNYVLITVLILSMGTL